MDRHVTAIEIVEDNTKTGKCDEGFLRLRRLQLQNTFSDGTTSRPYACDIVSRRFVDAVAVVLYHKDEHGTPWVHYREGTRPPVWLRRDKQAELPYKDPRPYDSIGEIVAGVLEADDHGAEGVRRRGALEAHEEAGYEVDPSAAAALGTEGLFPTPGVTDEKIYLVAVEIDPASKGEVHGDGSVMEEGTTMISKTLQDAIRACRTGAIPDAKTELGFLRLADHLGYLPQLGLYRDQLPAELRERFDPLGL